MPLRKRYNRTDLVQVLGRLGQPVMPIVESGFDKKVTATGSMDIPLCYLKDDKLIFMPVMDAAKPLPQMRTLEEAIEAAKDARGNDMLKVKSMIFPVGEIRFNRKHWVTLHYDVDTQTATLIDSRPWYISFWYPASDMKQALIDNGFNVSCFNTIYQNIQHDDTHCGAWTAANILAISEGQANVANLADYFSAYDKFNLISHNLKLAKNISEHSRAYRPLPTTFAQRHKGKLLLLSGVASLLIIGGLLAATGGLAAIPIAGILAGGMSALTGGLLTAGIVGAGLILASAAGTLFSKIGKFIWNNNPQDYAAEIIEEPKPQQQRVNIPTSYGTITEQTFNKRNLNTPVPVPPEKDKCDIFDFESGRKDQFIFEKENKDDQHPASEDEESDNEFQII